ncbi:RNA dependent RNA polymerase [Plasmopara viticola lesion associated ourmia-like virus 71]|uniref:RNA dependent RNA polymerase n=1 Tax=Plasmopara viticola lesion associated ourmia-like virus 71 TaxID=2686544 RepID=A0ABX6FJ03_9VIRU|nr:RNA dependent RNA polymerase [Plasmopara viticola lesion associated ourmia-like virus 71]QGY72601.1 RNA dependent RNA polymerase [Plasmopara viticola lesion associated ourmia-like virus 71]
MTFGNDKPAARQCRDYNSRTVQTVTRAVSTWARLFERPLPSVTFSSKTCIDLSAEVKEMLASCPSSIEEERMAWQSIKKLLPDSCRCMNSPLIQKVAAGFKRPPRILPRGYLKFARRVTSSLFRLGWDQGVYEDHVLTTSPPLSGSTDCVRSEGGVLGSGIDQPSFLDACLRGFQGDIDFRAELTVVQSAGKPRPLSKFSAGTLYLRPLHKAIYDTLSSQRWLCRGDVTTEKLCQAGFVRIDGEVLTSGDYKSATDGLSIEVAEVILECLLAKSSSVPASIQRAALQSLRPNLFSLSEDLDFVPNIGQMMGSYLSFPLLCLQNYIAFAYAAHIEGRNVDEMPLMINGDDILFRSDPEFSQRWMDLVLSLGLEVERTKTSVDHSYGSLNSTLIRRKAGKYVVVPTVRFGMLRHCENFLALSSVFRDFVAGIRGSLRYRVGQAFFSWHLSEIKLSRLTTLELGFRGSLAWRLTRKWGLKMAPLEYSPPKDVVDHNVVLSSERCRFVDPATVSKESRYASAREMASWKFSIEFSRDLVSRGWLDFYIQLSSIRRDSPDFSSYLSGFGERCRITTTIAETLRRFLVPVPVRLESFAQFFGTEVLEDVLPTYEEAVRDFGWVEVTKGDRK